MKRIILILLLFSNYLTAQQWQPTSIRQRFVNGIGIPTRDTLPGALSDSSQLVLRPQDSIVYFKYKGYWRALGGGAAAFTSTLQHEVKAGEAITKGQAVYVTSADGTNMIVSKASNATEATSSKTLGLIASTLSTNGKGYVITEGLLAGLNTSSALAGDPVWLGTNGNLIYGLTNKPYAPDHLVFIGIVTRSNSSNGEIFVKPQNGFELNEIHDVAINSPRNQSILLYDSTNKLWRDTLASVVTANKVNISDTAAMLTPYLRSNIASATYEPKITPGTTAQYWRGDKSWQTLPVYTLAGLGGQPQLNGTGFVKASGTTISYDNSSYYLASNPNGYTSNTGTVTSVGGTGTVSGLTLTGSVTTSGSLTLGGSLTLTSAQITSGLGYTPYNSTNPSGYITSSALSAYLPLTGGTLTGDLSGTSATFSGDVQSNGIYRDYQGEALIQTTTGAVTQIGTTGAGTGRSIQLLAGNTIKATLTTSGNLGLGVTPSAWGSVLKAFDIGTSGSLVSSASGAGGLSVAKNAYYNGSAWIYKNNSTAQFYEQDAGQHAWYTAPSGTAGNAISFTQAMTLNASGFLGIGETNPTSRLHIQSSASGGQNIRIQTSVAAGRNYIQFANGSGDMGYMGYGGADSKFYIVNQLADDMLFVNNGATRLTLASTGAATFSSSVTAGGRILASYNNTNSASQIAVSNTSTSGQYTTAGIDISAYNGTSVTSGAGLFQTASTFSYHQIGANQTNLYGLQSGGIRIATVNAPIIFSNGSSDADFSTEKMRISTSGNVGIGTTSPAEKLSVAGRLLVNTNTTDGANALQVNGSAKISSLAGTGERLVGVDASGKLVVSANISSGYYTPTITLINGIASATASPLIYTNINGIVTVTGKITINSNSITEGNQLEINLPASNPNVSPNSVGGCGVEITTAPTRNQDVLNFNSAFNYAKIAITFKSNATGSKVYTFSFSYDSNYFP